MGFTYSPDSPGTRDKLRALIGDTNQDEYIFEDSELDIFLNRHDDSLNAAAADACRAIAFSTAKQAMVVKLLDTTIDRQRIPYIYLRMADTFDKNESNAPIEYMDSFSVGTDEYGVDTSEYINDDEL